MTSLLIMLCWMNYQMSFKGIIEYNVFDPLGDKFAVTFYGDSLVELLEITLHDWDPAYKLKNIFYNPRTGENWSADPDVQIAYPYWDNLTSRIKKASFDSLAPPVNILGFSCSVFTIVYEEKISEFGTTLVFDRLWVSTLKAPVSSFNIGNHQLFHFPEYLIPLRYERTIETISNFEDTFTSTITYEAKRILNGPFLNAHFLELRE